MKKSCIQGTKPSWTGSSVVQENPSTFILLSAMRLPLKVASIFLNVVYSVYLVTSITGVSYSFMISSNRGLHISGPSITSTSSNQYNWLPYFLTYRVKSLTGAPLKFLNTKSPITSGTQRNSLPVYMGSCTSSCTILGGLQVNVSSCSMFSTYSNP